MKRLNRLPLRLLAVALALLLSHLLALALGADAGLDALTGMHPGLADGMLALLYALSWMGAVAVAPILALTGALWLLLRRVFSSGLSRAGIVMTAGDPR